MTLDCLYISKIKIIMKFYTKEIIEDIEKKYLEGEIINRNDKIYHQNILGLRKAYLRYSHNGDELTEYVNANTDMVYFAEKTLKLNLYNFQKEMLENLSNNNKIINIVSRQIGSSLVLSIFYLHQMIFNDNYKILYISNKKHSSVKFIDKIKFVYHKLPFFIKMGVLKTNKTGIEFENGSKIVLYDNDENFNSVTISEFSNIYNSEEIYNKYKDNDKLFIFSQPNGMNFFYHLYQDSKQNKNEFKTFYYYWWQVPNRDDKWKIREISRTGSEYKFFQDYDLQFLIK